MSQYCNIHTHRPAEKTIEIGIHNLYEGFDKMEPDAYYSIGLHPWYLENHEHDFLLVKAHASKRNVLAIGECGLDRLAKTDMQLQIEVFIKHIILANHLDKPLVIHCVRAFDELLAVFDEYHPGVPVIFHGFNKSWTMAEKLISRGYYLSFGAALLNEGSPAAEVLFNVPQDRFVLETDEANYPISEVYKVAAQIRKTPLDTIILQVRQNFKNLFSV